MSIGGPRPSLRSQGWPCSAGSGAGSSAPKRASPSCEHTRVRHVFNGRGQMGTHRENAVAWARSTFHWSGRLRVPGGGRSRSVATTPREQGSGWPGRGPAVTPGSPALRRCLCLRRRGPRGHTVRAAVPSPPGLALDRQRSPRSPAGSSSLLLPLLPGPFPAARWGPPSHSAAHRSSGWMLRAVCV